MRIVWVADTFDEGFGGGVVSARRFVEALRARHEVTVITTGRAGAGKIIVPGVQLPIEAMRGNGFTFGWPSRAAFDRAFARADLVHVSFGFTLGIAALRRARRMGLPCVTAFHVQPENLLYNIGLRSAALSRLLYRAWARYFYEPSDGVICPSPFAERILRAYGVSKPCFVVSNGVPEHLIARERDAPQGTITVLAVGRFAPEKRQDVILDAVARSRFRERIRLVMVGSGPRERALRAHADALGLRAELGPVSEAELTALYSEADVFIHAGEVELEGMAVLEAMGSGLPALVAASSESAASQFATGPAFLFRPGDPGDLAARLDTLLGRPDLLRDASSRACLLARQHEFANCIASLEHAYESIYARCARRSRSTLTGSRPPRLAS